VGSVLYIRETTIIYPIVFQKKEKSTSSSKLEFPKTQENQIQVLLQHQVSDYDHLTFFFIEKLDFFHKVVKF